MRFTVRFYLEYHGSCVKDDSRRSRTRKLFLFESIAIVSFRGLVFRIVLFVVTDFMELSRYMYTWNINRWLKIILWFLKLFIHLKFIHLSHLHLTFMKIILCANTSKNYYILLKAIILSSYKMNILEYSGIFWIRFRWHKIDLFSRTEQFQKYLLSVIPLLLVDNERKICLW